MKNKMVWRAVSLAVMILLMITIFVFSHQDATQSSDLSGGLTYKIFCLCYPGFEGLSVEAQEQLLGSAEVFIRKTAHFTLYFFLGAAAFGFYVTFEKFAIFTRAGLAFLTGVFYAASDEIHQIYIPGRSGEIRDVLIDSAGVLLACVILLAVGFLTNRMKRNRYG